MSSGVMATGLFTSLRLIRVGFFPVLVVSNASMVFGAHALVGSSTIDATAIVVVAANIGWMLYGSLLNDFYDAPMDRHNESARKVFSDPSFTAAKKRAAVLLGVATVVVLDASAVVLLARDGASRLIPFLIATAIGAFSATAYSLPPVRARKRLLGASWTLMIYHPFCLTRLLIASAAAPLIVDEIKHPRFIFALVFLWLIHAITTISMKDIADVFADARGGVRSIPVVFGPTGTLISAFAIVTAVFGAAVYGVGKGYLTSSFYVALVPVCVAFLTLSIFLHRWFVAATGDPEQQNAKTPRALYHATAYPLSWAVLIPAFMWCIR